MASYKIQNEFKMLSLCYKQMKELLEFFHPKTLLDLQLSNQQL